MVTENSIIGAVSKTESWQSWRKRYEAHLKPNESETAVNGILNPIPPDTYSSLRADMQTGEDTVPFSKIVEELTPQRIQAVLESGSPMAAVVVMQFFRIN